MVQKSGNTSQEKHVWMFDSKYQISIDSVKFKRGRIYLYKNKSTDNFQNLGFKKKKKVY